MIAILVNKKKINEIRRKRVGKTRKINFLNHHQATIMISPMIVITDANDVRGRAIG